ncbi:MAG TPA: sigma 54-interacting transcriptional regulator [Gemmata sp.]|nr:sigma 54-interacting transcriptional regulator [Gemmata sp.]
MAPFRRLVIAGQARHAAEVQAHLEKALQIAAPTVRLEEVAEILSPETDGDLLLVASEPSDASAVEAVIRETRVQQFPAKLSLLESAQVRDLRLLDHLTPHVAVRWLWPTHARELTMWAGAALESGHPFADPASESAAQKIRRRLINHTPSLTPMVEQLAAAADHDVPVLIEGEPGTGKSYLARLIHDCSPRRQGKFLTVGCGSLTGLQVAGELFGHAGAAGADATAAKAGKLSTAHNGTLYLDEIESLAPDQQANLLRVIETGEFEPLGSDETRPTQARVIAASNWHLADAVERGAFRRDLYYGLQVVHLQLPPLRERPEDVAPLVRGMLARYGSRFGKRLFAICPEALRTLEAFSWPGNIRQLENVVQQAVLASSGNELKVYHLPPAVRQGGHEQAKSVPVPLAFAGTLKQTRESTERANILRALEKTGQSRTRAAALLGVSRVTLYKKMKKYGLSPKHAKQVAVAPPDDDRS